VTLERHFGIPTLERWNERTYCLNPDFQDLKILIQTKKNPENP
jgi:hypothetical protein